MPLVRIDLLQGKSAEYRRALGNIVHETMLATIDVPVDDRFQIVTEHAPGDFIVGDNLHRQLGCAVRMCS